MPSSTESASATTPVSGKGLWRPHADSPGELPVLLLGGQWFPVQSGSGRAVYRAETASGTFFVKHYFPRGQRRFRDFVLRAKPQRALGLGRLLVERRISTPNPLGLYWRGGRFLAAEALLVSEWLREAHGCPTHLGGRASPERDPAGFLRGLEDLARLLGSLHGAGLYHGDLPGNILFAATPGGYRPFLVDLDDLRRRLSRKRRAKNLEELVRTVPGLRALPSGRHRHLFMEYAHAAGLERAELRRLWSGAELFRSCAAGSAA